MSSSRALCCLPSEQGQAKVQHKPPILDDDLKKLYESGVFNSDHSKTLLNKVFFEIMLCFADVVVKIYDNWKKPTSKSTLMQQEPNLS